jgi:hypothetical protein
MAFSGVQQSGYLAISSGLSGELGGKCSEADVAQRVALDDYGVTTRLENLAGHGWVYATALLLAPVASGELLSDTATAPRGGCV